MKKINAAKIVSSSIIGLDFQTVVIAGKAFAVHPPTIAKICGATAYLSELGDADTLGDVLRTLASMDKAVKALSWLIQGDEGLAGELAEATFDEVVNGLETALSLISTENFIRLSTLARSVRELTAKQR